MNPKLLPGVLLCFLHLGKTSQNTKDMYEELEDGRLCSSQSNIKTEADCKEAALELGLEFYKSWDGHGQHPGCLHAVEHGDSNKVDKVFFNTSPNPGTTTYPGYLSICEKSTIQVDGGWSTWSYGVCSKNCGGGTQKGTRSCNNPPPTNGGNYCEGSAITNRQCNTQPCPVDGGWSTWSYGVCSKNCGGGTQRGTRSCNNPPPTNGGNNCEGSGVTNRQCNTLPCSESLLAIDGPDGIAELLNTSCEFPLPERRKAPISVTTADGKILVCGGGSPRRGGPSNICWQFNYQTKSWQQFTSFLLDRITASAVSLSKGVYVLGGSKPPSKKSKGVHVLRGSKQSIKTSEFLATGSSKWIRGPDIPGSGVDQSCAAKLNDTAFVVLGGWYDGYQARVYNEVTNNWTNWPRLTEGAARQSCVTVGDKVLMAGGFTFEHEYTDRTVVFDSRDGSVLKVGSLIHPRGLAGIGFIGGNVVILGGYDGSVRRKDGEMWNTDTEEWEIADISLKSPRVYVSLVNLVEKVECD